MLNNTDEVPRYLLERDICGVNSPSRSTGSPRQEHKCLSVARVCGLCPVGKYAANKGVTEEQARSGKIPPKVAAKIAKEYIRVFDRNAR